jgi:predicted transposase YbfD/YdcC
VLGQVAVDAKSNEITAVPKLLEMLSLKGRIVTLDAMGCQRAIAKTILDQGGDYVLALKANQPALFEDVRTFLDDPETTADVATHVDGGHGRVEGQRLCRYRLVAGQPSLAWPCRHRESHRRARNQWRTQQS